MGFGDGCSSCTEFQKVKENLWKSSHIQMRCGVNRVVSDTETESSKLGSVQEE